MYIHYDGKECISLWCDGKNQEEQGVVTQKHKAKSESHSSRYVDREEEVDIFQKLKKKHKDNFSGPSRPSSTAYRPCKRTYACSCMKPWLYKFKLCACANLLFASFVQNAVELQRFAHAHTVLRECLASPPLHNVLHNYATLDIPH